MRRASHGGTGDTGEEGKPKNFTTNHTNKYEQEKKTTELHGVKTTELHGGRGRGRGRGRKRPREEEEFYHGGTRSFTEE